MTLEESPIILNHVFSGKDGSYELLAVRETSESLKQYFYVGKDSSRYSLAAGTGPARVNLSPELILPPGETGRTVDLTLARDLRLDGKVVDITGQPLPGARFMISGLEEPVVSDEDGLFARTLTEQSLQPFLIQRELEVELLDEHRTLVYVAPGRIYDLTNRVKIPISALRSEPMMLVLCPDHSMDPPEQKLPRTGLDPRFMDSPGASKPAEVRVRLYPPAGESASHYVLSWNAKKEPFGDDGYARIGGVDAGMQHVLGVKSSMGNLDVATEWRLRLPNSPVDNLQSAVLDYELDLEQEALAEGRLMAGGQPVAGLRVSLEAADRSLRAWAWTDEEGRFAIPGFKPGRALLSIDGIGESNLYQRGLVLGENGRNLIIDLPTGRITGRVTGLEGNRMLVNGSIRLHRLTSPQGERSARSIRADEGRFDIPNVRSGCYLLRFADWNDETLAQYGPFELGAGEALEDVALNVSPRN